MWTSKFLSFFGQLSWEGQPAIYPFVADHIDAATGDLRSEGFILPDEEKISKGGLRWVAGGMDGAFGHHVGSGDREKVAKRLLPLLETAVRKPSHATKAAFYNELLKSSALEYIDALLPLIPQSHANSPEQLYKLARWLAIEAPDREPVKFGISLLGLLAGWDHRNVFLTLGKHEEFTLYAGVAIMRTEKDPEPILWELARHVHGWGRVQLVERLADTKNPAIQAWLLRDGYKNNVMYEYLAAPCARAGRLVEALRMNPVEESVLEAAGDLLEALINGGPAEDIDDYEDGALAMECYLQLLREKASTLRHYLVAHAIQRFLNDDKAKWDDRAVRGWTPERRDHLRRLGSDIVRQPRWTELTQSLKGTDDPVLFYQVKEAASHLGINLWDRIWARVQAKPEDSGRWYDVMRLAAPSNIETILTFAKKAIPLDRIGSGPAKEFGMGRDYQWNNSLDFILQELNRFPGLGWPLIRAGIKSPVVRNRNMALKALQAWQKDQWTAEVKDVFNASMIAEPDEKVRELMNKVRNAV